MKLISEDLSKNWHILKDEGDVGKSEGWETKIHSEAIPARIPSIIQEYFPNYHGTCWYWCKFVPGVNVSEGEIVHLSFGGADYLCEVWLNSVYLGSYEGGETPFSFEVTDKLSFGKENLIALRIVNPCERDIDGISLHYAPQRNKVERRRAGSCLNNGGLWYGVTLDVTPKVYIKDKFYIADHLTGNVKAKVYVNNTLKNEASSAVTIKVYENSYPYTFITEICKTVNLESGESELELSLNVPCHKIWDVDDPNLYRLTVELLSECGQHRSECKLGFREFKVEDGFFYLNGRRIFLKSAHTGNAFPIGIMYPVMPEHTRQDIIYAKASGFNMIRSIAGMLRPEQLEAANELGLLIYEECYASWCLGHSERDYYKNQEEFTALMEKYPGNDPGSLEKMLERWRGATDKMILRDRNHPSVVIWGLLNETRDNSVFDEAVAYFKRVRELDPTRLIILNAGRFDTRLDIGSGANPYVDHPEPLFGNDGMPETFDKSQGFKTVGDNHFYAPVPTSDEDISFYRTVGADYPRAVFMSEYGIGSLFNVIEERRHFTAYGARPDLEDYSWLSYQEDAFKRDFYAFGLNTLFPYPEALLKESQRVNADERARIFSNLRSNPKISGYSLTGLLDHGMCGEGLYSYWRRWKPEMFDTISDGFSKLRFSLFATANVFSGDEIELEATISNENVLKDGTYHASFAIISATGTHLSFSESFELTNECFTSRIFKRKIRIDLPEGAYKLVAELEEGSPTGGSVEFFVTERSNFCHTGSSVLVLGLSDDNLEFIKTFADVSEFDTKECNAKAVICDKVCKEEFAKIAKFVKDGGVACVLNAANLFEGECKDILGMMIPGIKFPAYYDWLYHKEYVLYDKEVFAGFDNDKILRLTRFGVSFPKSAFAADRTPDRVMCPGFLSGYYGVDDAYASCHSLAGYKYGDGMIYLSTFRLTDAPHYPVCEKILYNLTKFIVK